MKKLQVDFLRSFCYDNIALVKLQTPNVERSRIMIKKFWRMRDRFIVLGILWFLVASVISGVVLHLFWRQLQPDDAETAVIAAALVVVLPTLILIGNGTMEILLDG